MAKFIQEEDLKISCPARITIVGASGSGKSEITRRLIENEYMFKIPFESVLYFYNEENSTIKKIRQNPKVELKQGFDYDMILEKPKTGGHFLVVIDDHMTASIYHHLAEIFAVKSRALNFSVILITQNLFTKGGNAKNYNRDILINSTHSCLFANRRDQLGVMSIARASFPTRYKFFMHSYHSACQMDKSGHGYL